MGQMIDAEERRITRRLAAIDDRLSELSTMWDFAADTDVQYRMIEAEKAGLRAERERLKELRGDL